MSKITKEELIEALNKTYNKFEELEGTLEEAHLLVRRLRDYFDELPSELEDIEDGNDNDVNDSEGR